MNDLLKKITEIFKKKKFTDLNNANDEKKLLYLYSFYHYYCGDDDCLNDVSDHCHYDRNFQNFAQGIFEEDDLENRTIDILIPYFVSASKDFSVEQVEFRITQTSAMVSRIKNGTYQFAEIESMIPEYWNPESDDKLVLKVITNYEPNFDEKNNIQKVINDLHSFDSRISFDIVFGDDIVNEISQLTSDKKNVEYGELILDKKDNFLVYGEEESIITNIRASSLKDNYIKFGKAGLFAMNLRFYVANKKVDAGIEDTIKNKGDKFWYFNNGLIIVCDDFKIENEKISLKNFSIVNGGQTTRMIGVIPFEKDFAVPCKIIRNKYRDDLENNFKFVSEIAEASNTQKPINSSDIIANRVEQRILKAKLAEIGIFLQIKRGDAATANLKDNYPKAWQKTKNSELAQLIYAAICQRPGTARNSKDKIFSNKDKYNAIFGDLNYDMNIIKDLLFLKNHYKKWSNLVQKDPFSSEQKKGLVKNGYYFFSAALVLMAKFAFSKDLTDYLKNVGIKSEQGLHIISQRTFNHRIFEGDFEFVQPKIYELFNLIYEKYILKEFTRLKEIKPELVYSNYTKIDKNYLSYITEDIFEDFAYEINNRVAGCINTLFHRESLIETNETREIVNKLISDYSSGIQENQNLLENENDTIKQQTILNEKSEVIKNSPIKIEFKLSDWENDVLECILNIGKDDFYLKDIYNFQYELALKYPNNNNIQAKIRQILQNFRDLGIIKFLEDGHYALIK